MLFGRALEHVTPLGGDPDCILARYWASLEADRFRSTEEARKIWTDVLAVLGDRARFWMEQVQVIKTQSLKTHSSSNIKSRTPKCRQVRILDP